MKNYFYLTSLLFLLIFSFNSCGGKDDQFIFLEKHSTIKNIDTTIFVNKYVIENKEYELKYSRNENSDNGKIIKDLPKEIWNKINDLSKSNKIIQTISYKENGDLITTFSNKNVLNKNTSSKAISNKTLGFKDSNAQFFVCDLNIVKKNKCKQRPFILPPSYFYKNKALSVEVYGSGGDLFKYKKKAKVFKIYLKADAFSLFLYDDPYNNVLGNYIAINERKIDIKSPHFIDLTRLVHSTKGGVIFFWDKHVYNMYTLMK